MKKTNKIILASSIVAVLLLGIGYAAIQNITLNISGSAAADPSQSNFKVMFSGTPTVSDDTYVTAAITDDTNATVNVEGLTKKGDVVTATYTVQNASTDLSADLAVSTTNSNTEYFTLMSELDKSSLVAGEATTLTVTVELTKTPIVESVSTTIGVQLEAMPVQPGEEGTSEGINDFAQTPDERNQYGFYFDQAYSATLGEETGTFIFHEDTSCELYVDGKILQKFPVGSTTYDSFTIDGTSIDMGILTVSSDGRQIIVSNDEMIFVLDLSFAKETIPEGAMYIHLDLDTMTAIEYDTMPIPSQNDIYINGDYMYVFDSQDDGWEVNLFQDVWKTMLTENTDIQIESETTDGSQTAYDPILEEICGAPIVSMTETFLGCVNLITAPEIPSGVKTMSNTFSNCVSLVEAPVLPDGVIYLSSTFSGCTSLVNSPAIPNTVKGLLETFSGCKSLKNAPIIPNGVTGMYNTFRECTSLTGEVIINANPTDYEYCFYGVDFASQNLTLAGESTMLDEIGATGNNYTTNQ